MKVRYTGTENPASFVEGKTYSVLETVNIIPKMPLYKIKDELGVTCMLVDANDFERDILGKSPDLALTDAQCAELIRDNPAGNSTQLTPFILIRKAE